MKSSVVAGAALSVISLSCPPSTLAAGKDTDTMTSLEERRALSNRIKELRELRKKLPIPVPSGLFGI